MFNPLIEKKFNEMPLGNNLIQGGKTYEIVDHEKFCEVEHPFTDTKPRQKTPIGSKADR